MSGRKVAKYTFLFFWAAVWLLTGGVLRAQDKAQIDSLELIARNAPEEERSKMYNDLCWKLRNFDPDCALEYGKTALAYAQKFNDTEQILRSYSFVGVCYRNLAKYKEAYEIYDKGLVLAEEVGNKEQTAYCHINIGNLYLYYDDYTQALPHLEKALKIGLDIRDSSVLGYAYLNLGRTCIGTQEYTRALTYLTECLDLRNKRGEDKDKIATVNKYLGDAEFSAGNLNNALKYYNDAINLKDEMKDYDLLSVVYGQVFEVYFKMGNYNAALVYAKECLKASKIRALRFRMKNAYTYLAEAYRAKRNIDSALAAYDVVMQYSDTVFNEWKIYGMSNIHFAMDMMKKKSEIEVLNRDKQLREYFIWIMVLIAVIVLGVAVFFVFQSSRRKKTNALLSNKNHLIEMRNEEISAQRDTLAAQQKEIRDSITYAQRIQFSMLPEEETLKDYFTDGFILYKPRDVVSGDFYKIFTDKDYFVLLVADCTGHGVPGAFMSMLGMAAFNEIVGREGIRSAGEVMNLMRDMIKKTLKQDIKDAMRTQDGMDAALVIVDKKTDVLYYSGAHIPFLCFRGGEEIALRPVHNPVGVYVCERPFVSVEFPLQKGDKIYLSSDGYHSQFGGDSDRLLKTSGYKKILREVLDYGMGFQKKLLDDKFTAWQGSKKQTDDVLVVGLEV